MPKFLEQRLLNAAHARGLTGRAAKRYEFGAMNNMGAMHGNKETAKGREMEAQHEKDTAMKKTAEPMREMRIEIHRGPKKEVTGYTVHHHMVPKPHGKSSAFYEDTHISHPFSADEHEKMAEHVANHLAGQSSAKIEAEPAGDHAKENEENEAYDGE